METVTIPLERYDELVTNENNFLFLKNALYQNAFLGYGGSMHFDAAQICTMLKAIDYPAYKTRLSHLIEQEGKKGE